MGAKHGGRREGAGRPRGSRRVPLWVHLTVAFRPEERARLDEHCKSIGKPKSQFVREASLAEIERGKHGIK